MNRQLRLFSLIFILMFLSFAPVKADWGGKVDPNNIKKGDDLREFSLKIHGISLENSDLKNRYDFLITTSFDTLTKWPPKDKLPENFKPSEIIEKCKDPGLNVRDLHKSGITGKGVKVAIIDQPLLKDHEEYKNKIVKYTEVGATDEDKKNGGWKTSAHGPAVTSLLAGNKCGTAPDASIYYYAEPTWKKDYKYPIEILDEIIAYNKYKPVAEKIRIVSFSLGFGYDFKNFVNWEPELKKAKEAGLIVIHCNDIYEPIGCPLNKDRNNPSNYYMCFKKNKPGTILVPVDNRSYASGFGGKSDYCFDGIGGNSWGAPYLAGVIALALQVNPELNEEILFRFLRETATPLNDGLVINPVEFIKKIKLNKKCDLKK